MLANLSKSALHNVGVILVGFAVAALGRWLDGLLGLSAFHAALTVGAGVLLIAAGFLLRLWATFDFYENSMKVISLVPQRTLITSGAYRLSRNPLYLGGNGFIFFGAALVLGSPTALIFTAIHLPLIDLFIKREERQLEVQFGDEWRAYKARVRRWI